MLVAKNSPEILVLRLVNNDEIITNVIQQDDKEYIVENPFILIMTQEGGMQYSPMLVMGEAGAPITIYKSGVVARTIPSKKMKDVYEKSTQKIVMPIKQGIII